MSGPGDNGGLAKLRRFRAQLEALGATQGSVSPTEVIARLSEERGKPLLQEMPESGKERARRAWKATMQEAIKRFVRSKSTRPEAAMERAYRRGIEIYLRELYAAVQRGAWGRVTASTRERKRRARSSAIDAWGVRDGWLREQLAQPVEVRRGR